MDLTYRLLGIAARLSERMSHFRVNFVPINWAVMVLLGAFAITGASVTRDALVNGQQPRAVKVGELLEHRNLDRNYVSVKAPLVRYVLSEHEKGSDVAERTWGLLLDPETKRGMLAEFEGPVGSPSDEVEVTALTGMVVSLKGDVRRKMEEAGGKIDDVPVELDYVLKTGDAPGSAVVGIVTTLVCGIPLALLLIVFAMKYTIFRRTGDYGVDMAAMSAEVPEQGIDLRATGRFVLDQKNAQRFLDMPVAMGTLETGELALVANVDASRSFMGITTEQRKGYWGLVMEHGSVSNVERGILYIGTAARPALRFRYRVAGTRTTDTAIVSVGNAAEREAVAAELSKVAGYSVATA